MHRWYCTRFKADLEMIRETMNITVANLEYDISAPPREMSGMLKMLAAPKRKKHTTPGASVRQQV